MKVQCTLIIRTFRGMAATIPWIHALRSSLRPKQPFSFRRTYALANPQSSRSYSEWMLAAEEEKRKYKAQRKYDEDESFGKNFPSIIASEYNNKDFGKNVPSVTAEFVAKDSRGYNNGEDESLRASAEIPRPRPQAVPWQRELDNTVHFIGRICQPVQFKCTQSGAFAWTRLVIRCLDYQYSEERLHGSYPENLWFLLAFSDDLAETAARHLKKNDRVYVSGCLGLLTTGEDDLLKVNVRTLKFVEEKFQDYSQQAVVSKNTPSVHLSKQTVINKGPSHPYKKSQVKSSNSGNELEVKSIIASLWQEFFANPLKWWDNRKNKRNPRIPDFRHRDTGEALWIEGKFNPSWVKDQLTALDSRMKVLEECGRGRTSARSQGSLSSSQDSCF